MSATGNPSPQLSAEARVVWCVPEVDKPLWAREVRGVHPRTGPLTPSDSAWQVVAYTEADPGEGTVMRRLFYLVAGDHDPGGPWAHGIYPSEAVLSASIQPGHDGLQPPG